MSNSNCFRDFCLACDREAPDGPYCSQSCRLMDLEKGESDYTSQQAYIVHPALLHRKAPPTTKPVGRTSSSYDTMPKTFSKRVPMSRPKLQPQQRSTASRKGSQHQHGEPLTPTSSQSSVESNKSTQSPNDISDEAKMELQQYFHSFDQTRTTKRRQSMC